MILDVTLALRSIPMIVFAVAAYLRRTKHVNVARVVYGAFEARDDQSRAPILDLTLLVDLLDWVGAAEFMLQRSDAVLLAERLQRIQGQARRRQAGQHLPKDLQTVAAKLRSLSDALQLARPRDVMRHAQDLLPLLGGVASEAEQWAKPFAIIIEQVRSEVGKFAHNAPDILERENLRKQLTLIEHFIEKGLLAQAILLSREWVVSWTALQKGDGDWLDKNYRESELEKALSAAGQRRQGKLAEVPPWFDQLPNAQKVSDLWNQLSDLRNDLAHCGMRKDARGIQSIKSGLTNIPPNLRALLEGTPDRVLYGRRVVVDLKSLYGEVAKLDELPLYLERAKELAGEGNEVVLTGQAPVWLYLAVAHALHGKARRLLYSSPTTGEVPVFDHSAS